MPKKLVNRSEVPVEDTWDLHRLYATDEDMYKELEKMQKDCAEAVKRFKGNLKTADNILAYLDFYEKFNTTMDIIYNYASLGVSTDYTNAFLRNMEGKVGKVITECYTDLSFARLEILRASDEVLEEAIEKATSSKNYLKDLLREKPHTVSEETEAALTSLSDALNLPYNGYETTKMADIAFPDFTVNGKEYPLGYSLFEDHYEYEPDTAVRRAAFDNFSRKIREYVNTTANYYNTQVQKEKILSKLYHHDTVFDYLLFDDKVSMDLYNRQIDVIMKELAPHMRKYAGLIKRIHKLDKMTYADLKLPIDPGYAPKATKEQAREYIEAATAFLGDDYKAMVGEAFDKRWIDFAQNIGKSTGGFCSSPYRKGSYILLNWHEEMSDVFTLAHELGHAGHFMLCGNEQSDFDTNVSGYMVESPSTMNELLLANYLIKTKDDPRFKRFVYSCMVSNTYYHNFVTHLLEADFQREVYRLVEKGETLQAETLNEIMHNTLEKFWGDAVELTEGAELTWMRQPHYYMGLYSYTYSAGLTVATQVSRRILDGNQEAVEGWKKLLKAGSTEDSIGLAALAGVDITTDKPLKDAIAYIGSLIDEIERLTDELEKQ